MEALCHGRYRESADNNGPCHRTHGLQAGVVVEPSAFYPHLGYKKNGIREGLRSTLVRFLRLVWFTKYEEILSSTD